MKKKTEIYSIFGQIEAVAAEAMITAGVAKRIHANLIPPTVRFNENGDGALFAIIIDRVNLPEFEERIANLRA